ncbi:MAG TPA: hypothetical protein VMV10_04615 [Pirellulales bacterium]|nr:hypothetical protein [Pirellulales bacterium]
MANKQDKKQDAARIGRQDDPGLPGGGQGRVDITGKSDWTPPEGEFPPGEGYEESGRSGVISPDRFAEKQGQQPSGAKGPGASGA